MRKEVSAFWGQRRVSTRTMSDLGDATEGAPSERGCCARCVNGLASSILVFINIIFLLVGVAMTGGSAYGLHTWEKWKPLLGTPLIVYWAMGIGIFMLLLSLLAIIGTCLKNQVSMRGMRGVVRGGSDGTGGGGTARLH